MKARMNKAIGDAYNHNGKDTVMINKMMNSMFKYAYLTDEDFKKIDEIDNKILNLDNKLFELAKNEKRAFDEKDMYSNFFGRLTSGNDKATAVLNLLCAGSKILSSITSPHIELIKEREILVNERDELINGAIDKMKDKNPEAYKTITQIINKNRLKMAKGDFDLQELLSIGIQF